MNLLLQISLNLFLDFALTSFLKSGCLLEFQECSDFNKNVIVDFIEFP